MNERLRLVGALTLVAVGLLCIVYALAMWESTEPVPRETLNPSPAPTHDPALPDPTAQPGPPAAPLNPPPGTPVVTPPAGQGAQSGPPPTLPGGTPPAPVKEPLPEQPQLTPDPDLSDRRTDDAAAPVSSGSNSTGTASGLAKPHREALKLWVVAGLPLVFVVLIVVILVLRWFRPKPMPHTGPSDTTDLWLEAGKRFRLP